MHVKDFPSGIRKTWRIIHVNYPVNHLPLPSFIWSFRCAWIVSISSIILHRLRDAYIYEESNAFNTFFLRTVICTNCKHNFCLFIRTWQNIFQNFLPLQSTVEESLILPKRHMNVHMLCIAAENIPRCMKFQKNHITVINWGLQQNKKHTFLLLLM